MSDPRPTDLGVSIFELVRRALPDLGARPWRTDEYGDLIESAHGTTILELRVWSDDREPAERQRLGAALTLAVNNLDLLLEGCERGRQGEAARDEEIGELWELLDQPARAVLDHRDVLEQLCNIKVNLWQRLIGSEGDAPPLDLTWDTLIERAAELRQAEASVAVATETAADQALEGVFAHIRAIPAHLREPTIDTLKLYREGGLSADEREQLAIILKLRPDLRAELEVLNEPLEPWVPPVAGPADIVLLPATEGAPTPPTEPLSARRGRSRGPSIGRQ